MGKKIYIGNLPWSITKVKLEDLFSPFGELEDALVVANKYTGRSRGFGFVTFKDEESAKKAMNEMDKKEIEGRALVVKEARPLQQQRDKEKEPKQEQEEKQPVQENIKKSEEEN